MCRRPTSQLLWTPIRSYTVFVVGKVQKPGEFLREQPVSVLQSLSLAGGFQEYANRDSITVFRNRPSGNMVFKFNYDEVVEGKKASPEHYSQFGAMWWSFHESQTARLVRHPCFFPGDARLDAAERKNELTGVVDIGGSIDDNPFVDQGGLSQVRTQDYGWAVDVYPTIGIVSSTPESRFSLDYSFGYERYESTLDLTSESHGSQRNTKGG